MKLVIGRRVRELREGLDISQPEFAARITAAGYGPLSYQAIQQLEQGDVKRPKYAMYLAPILKTSWEYLTGDTDNPTPGDEGINDSSRKVGLNGPGFPREGGQEGPSMLTEISQMLGRMEGRMEARADARFKIIEGKLDDHERRLESLEERPISGPQKGRKR